MTAPSLGFTGFEAGENTGNWGLVGSGDSIQSGTALVGSFSALIDPVNANATFKTYGAKLQLPTNNQSTTRLQTLFYFRAPTTFYDELVSLYEIVSPGANLSRRLNLRKNTGGDPKALMLVDKDEDSIAIGTFTLVGGNNYLIRVDTQLNKDVVWLYDIDGTASWTKEIDVDDWGDITTPFSTITLGTELGKTLPTTGGPHFIDEVCVLDMEGSTPSSDSIGSVTTRLLIPTGMSGDNTDFNTGTGTNPDWNDVKEFPNDGDTSYDEGDVVGDQQGYDVTDATGTEVPLALQIVGYASRNGGSGDEDLDYKYGFYRPTGAVFDMSDTVEEHSTPPYRALGLGNISGAGDAVQQRKIWNDFNGSPWTNAIVDEIQPTVEVIQANNSAKLRLTNIGVEYYIESGSSPADFPDAPTATGTGVDEVSISVL